MPRLSTDDDVYRFRAVWLGPKGKRLGFEARYLAWAIGTVCWVLATPAVFTLARTAPAVLVAVVAVVTGVGVALLLRGTRVLGLVWAAGGGFLTLLVAGGPPDGARPAARPGRAGDVADDAPRGPLGARLAAGHPPRAQRAARDRSALPAHP